MKRLIGYLKETVLYVGIIVISCVSALWFFIQRKSYYNECNK